MVCFQKDELDAFKELGTGNRIATWLLYVSTALYGYERGIHDGWLTVSPFTLQMSDVQAGGATVFTDIGVSMLPKKVCSQLDNFLSACWLWVHMNSVVLMCVLVGVSRVLVQLVSQWSRRLSDKTRRLSGSAWKQVGWVSFSKWNIIVSVIYWNFSCAAACQCFLLNIICKQR